jgi:hypothetical protein
MSHNDLSAATKILAQYRRPHSKARGRSKSDISSDRVSILPKWRVVLTSSQRTRGRPPVAASSRTFEDSDLHPGGYDGPWSREDSPGEHGHPSQRPTEQAESTVDSGLPNPTIPEPTTSRQQIEHELRRETDHIDWADGSPGGCPDKRKRREINVTEVGDSSSTSVSHDDGTEEEHPSTPTYAPLRIRSSKSNSASNINRSCPDLPASVSAISDSEAEDSSRRASESKERTKSDVQACGEARLKRLREKLIRTFSRGSPASTPPAREPSTSPSAAGILAPGTQEAAASDTTRPLSPTATPGAIEGEPPSYPGIGCTGRYWLAGDIYCEWRVEQSHERPDATYIARRAYHQPGTPTRGFFDNLRDKFRSDESDRILRRNTTGTVHVMAVHEEEHISREGPQGGSPDSEGVPEPAPERPDQLNDPWL